jgi:predicted dehydrogenase
MTSRVIQRRSFLHASAAMAVSALLPSSTSSAQAAKSSDLRVAVIGLRGRGGEHIQAMWDNVAAICDVDQLVLDFWRSKFSAKKRARRVDVYSDFRKLLEQPDIDAVSIATCNHTHAWIAILAAQSGKHAYVEKPVSHSPWEGLQLVNAARRYSRVIQCGTQSRSNPGLHAAKRFLDSGKLGKIQYALGTCFKPRPSIGKLDKPLEIPRSLDYDLWCGPAAKQDIYRPQLHYDWHWDFNTGNGDIGNQGVHQVDIARWFLGENELPPRVLSIGGRVGYEDAGNTANTQIVCWDYPRAPILFEVRGLPAQKNSREMDIVRGARVGVIIQCERGHILVSSYNSATAYDVDGKPLEDWEDGGDRLHYANFLQAAGANDAAQLNAEVLEGHLSSTLCHLANISYRLGRRMTAQEIAESVKDVPLVSESVDRILVHLERNGLRRDAIQLSLGPWITIDPATQSSSMPEVQELMRRVDRNGFEVPEITV